eukprot:CAMPEP_0201988612 /NCGR_PEP_ID=MMETSP0904-20121228/92419_1 /ASSEMBLY_ACC=CAM_ASM_000553 /TAXON_ID=420261 /ORGANISM="Thalassiosira antarctica, Strain CCMP982" /LENGTH=512 /DNA_ID=CAMNT_0048542793 /DNA_START=70 /DNA_END=1605 /DNA_ORIENTATION=+
MTDSQPKFKFKKRSKASLKKKQLRRTTNDDATTGGGVKVEEIASSVVKVIADNDNITSSTTDTIIPNHTTSDDDDGEEEPSALTTIFAVERRRKILGRNNRGVDLTNLGKNTVRKNHHNATTPNKEESSEDPLMQNKDLEERLKVNFAGGKLAGSNDMGGDDEGGILAKKHRMAMEDFIQSNLSSTQEGGGASGSGTNNGSAEGEEEGQNKNNASEAEKEMYAELLTSDNKGDDGNNAPTGAEEGDVGAGGAMMGGTGIAEVALPIDERIKHLKETERAAMEYERSRKAARFGSNGDDGGMTISDVGEGGSNEAPNQSSIAERVPMNFASGPGKRKRQEDVTSIAVADPSSQTSTKSQSAPNAPMDHSNVQSSSSSALPPSSQTYSASSAGASVQKSDVSALGASYSHNFQLHTKEWVTRRRDERQVEIDATIAEQEAEEGPPESRARVGFEMSRKMARGEVVAPNAAAASSGGGGGKQGSGKGPNGESLRNDWDRKKGGGDQGRSNDDRVW